ncbi:maleylpyruvate isomerase family mycothiol-dependent enzyme [Streptomyces profundus]|uniref:maleylpyruvate isomerase family mycothiol-dependent enzyme n=1 Tax=Streptomyces profundus TaxID=2867410 RepID=UPI001D16E5D9|nr:maleylpyruvate isomerase family mycothiol-dependent enzyme [Streptomyces sp. MA3_2.13]UED87765.1 maleylpyruvate isomerase family mycothiol-dependent enzyme [Streptomyces sp. MA3_2.13]
MDDPTWLGPPIDARPLLAPELAELCRMLRALPATAWRAPAVPGWTVRDLAAHLLGDLHGRLGHGLRGQPLDRVRAPGETLEAWIHRGNQEWIDAHADLTPPALVDALERAAPQVVARFRRADPHAPAVAVSWAGADPAPAWLDCARELTEYWIHRQQIRHAVGQRTDPEPTVAAVVLDTLLRALPHTLRTHRPGAGRTQLSVRVPGPAGGVWTVTATDRGWSLALPPAGPPTATVEWEAEIAWRLCARSIDPATALAHARVTGERGLAEAAALIVSIVH